MISDKTTHYIYGQTIHKKSDSERVRGYVLGRFNGSRKRTEKFHQNSEDLARAILNSNISPPELSIDINPEDGWFVTSKTGDIVISRWPAGSSDLEKIAMDYNTLMHKKQGNGKKLPEKVNQ